MTSKKVSFAPRVFAGLRAWIPKDNSPCPLGFLIIPYPVRTKFLDNSCCRKSSESGSSLVQLNEATG